MPIAFGNNPVSAVYLGNQSISAVYRGADKIWPVAPSPQTATLIAQTISPPITSSEGNQITIYAPGQWTADPPRPVATNLGGAMFLFPQIDLYKSGVLSGTLGVNANSIGGEFDPRYNWYALITLTDGTNPNNWRGGLFSISSMFFQ